MPAFAAAVGTITDQSETPPEIQRKSTTLPGAKGTGVEMDDSIRTGNGKLGITFVDDTKVQMTEGSRLVIDEFVYDPNKKGAGKLAINIAMGTVRYASGQIAKNAPQNVAIETPSATVTVRGTDFTSTVDEVGRSTIVLLPSCPKGFKDVDKDCKTGEIVVTTDAGSVVMNRPFQATKVESRGLKPAKPVILHLSESDINNMLIVSPPRELVQKRDEGMGQRKGALDQDFLKEEGLKNEFDKQEPQFKDRLAQNLLEQNFLVNILDLVNAQLAAQLDLLNSQSGRLLPDYNALTNVKVAVDDMTVQLCRDDGSNVQCIGTNKYQNSLIIQQQGSVEIRNRVNNGAGTTITVKQSN
jgi:hypothetical protein